MKGGDPAAPNATSITHTSRLRGFCETYALCGHIEKRDEMVSDESSRLRQTLPPLNSPHDSEW